MSTHQSKPVNAIRAALIGFAAAALSACGTLHGGPVNMVQPTSAPVAQAPTNPLEILGKASVEQRADAVIVVCQSDRDNKTPATASAMDQLCTASLKLFWIMNNDQSNLSPKAAALLQQGQIANDNAGARFAMGDDNVIHRIDAEASETQAVAPPAPVQEVALPPAVDTKTVQAPVVKAANDAQLSAAAAAMAHQVPSSAAQTGLRGPEADDDHHDLSGTAIAKDTTPAKAQTPTPAATPAASPKANPTPVVTPVPANDNSGLNWIELIFGALGLTSAAIIHESTLPEKEQKRSLKQKFRTAAIEITAGAAVGVLVKSVASLIVAHTALAALPGVLGLGIATAASGAAVGLLRNSFKAKEDRKDWRAAALTGALFAVGGGILFAGAGGLLEHLFSHGSDAVAQHTANVAQAAAHKTVQHATQTAVQQTAAHATQTVAATAANNVSSVLTADQLHSLSPELQKMALSKSPAAVAKFCELAAHQLMSGQDHSSASFKAGVALLEKGADIVNGANDHSTWSRMLNRDLAKMAFRGFGMDKSKDVAIAYARHIGGTMGSKLLQAFAPTPA